MSSEPIAITGIACRFPGGIATPGDFWEFVLNGGDAIRSVPAERKSLWGSWPDLGDCPDYGGFLDDIDRFDASFFHISPREARHIDPQQRILLELAWEALEDAGIPPVRWEGQPVGVYTGIFLDEYWDLQRYATPARVGMHTNTGGTLSIAANRISYFLDLKGPSVSVDTACSSSLTAIHLACRDIQAGTCTAALAGGANLQLTPQTTRGFHQARMLSPDGRCRAFDQAASGYGRSDGAGVVVLKPLSAALRDGDSIYAVIHGSAINQDGRTRGLTIPDQLAQEAVIEAAARAGGMSAHRLDYVEAHGTGTPAGDPIEATAIGRATGSTGCYIGSVKTNIGHAEAAAGVAGLIKTALALKHGVLPPSLHFDRPNPDIPFEDLGLTVVTAKETIPGPTYAGVNSFGFGGANAHVVLGSPPESDLPEVRGIDPEAGIQATSATDRSQHPIDTADTAAPRILALSAHSTAALKEKASDTVSLLLNRPETPAADLAAASVLRRSHLEHRLAMVFGQIEQAVQGLETFCAGGLRDRLETGRVGAQPTPIVFVFTGMGPQWYGMGEELYHTAPVFREELDRFDRLFAHISGWSIRNRMFDASREEHMTDVETAQPANLALQWALARWYRSLGIEPRYVIGHSVGEIAGACVAGALSLEDGARVIYERSRLQKNMRGQGEMLAVGLSPEEAEQVIEPLGDRLTIAAVNSPLSVTISGETAAIHGLQSTIEDRQCFCRILNTGVAYHSGQMDGIRDEFLTSLAGISPTTSHVPLLSTVTGAPLGGEEFTAEHWWRNLRDPVVFDRVFEGLPGEGDLLFIQIGPHPVLSSAIYENLAHLNRSGQALATLRRDRGAGEVLLETVAKCYVHGHDINWECLVCPPRKPVALPPYPWQRERFWLDGVGTQTAGHLPHPFIGREVESSVDPDTRIWERAIGLGTHPILEDHTVLDRSIMPLAGLIEMLLETLDGVEVPASFTGFELANPLLLPKSEAHLVQIVRRQERYTFSSRPDAHGSETAWLLNCRAVRTTGTAGSGADRTPATIDLEAIESRCDRRSMGGRFYESAAEKGFLYGPAFRQIDEIAYNDREALVLLSIQDDEHEPYQLHPGVLDAGLQALLMLVPDEDPHLPVSVKSLELQRLPGHDERLYAYARMREAMTARDLVADVCLVDENGHTVVTLDGVVLSPTGGFTGRRKTGNPHGLYREEWKAAPPGEEPAASAVVDRWFVLSDDRKPGAELADALSRHGVPSEFIDSVGNCPGTRKDALSRKMKSLTSDKGNGVGIIGVWSGTGNESACLETGPAGEAFDLIRTLLDHPDLPFHLRLVTAGAQSVVPDDRTAPEHTSIWGCGRVAAREHPELNCAMIDLPSRIDGIDVARLAEIVRMEQSPEEIALRKSATYSRRLAPLDLERCETKTISVIHSNRNTYRLTQSMPGSIDDLRFETKSASRPGPDEVTIRVKAAGLNFRDVLTALGMLPPASGCPPSFGWECVGEITARGDQVAHLDTGDVVMGMLHGTMAGSVTARADLVVRKPDHLEIEEAVTLPVAYMTAYLGLVVRGEMDPGDRVLIHHATGGVGLAAVNLAQQAKAEIYATAGSPEKRAHLEAMGVSHTLDSRSLDFAEEIMRMTDGRGVDIVLNTLSGPAMTASISVLSSHGRFIEIGKTGVSGHETIDLHRFDHNRSYHPIDLSQLIRERPDRAGALLRAVVDMASDGRVRPLPYKVYPMDRARDAFRFMSQARHMGKLVLVDDGGTIPAHLGEEDPVIHPGGTYLVTGGAGGIGRFLTRWLLDREAGLVVVTGRRRREDVALDTDPDRNVRYVQADVTDFGAMESLIADLKGEDTPFKGVFHAAGVMDDGILLTQTAERFRRVLEPKTTGARHLHELTRSLELDLFVLFSSVASLAGTAGQAPYAAANAYLDGLADLRRSQGLPVTAINWGPWEETGMMLDERAADRLRRQGLRSIPPAEAGSLLERILRRDVHRLGVVPLEESSGDTWIGRMLAPDAHTEGTSEPVTTISKEEASALPAERLRAYIEVYVTDAICRIVEMNRGSVELEHTWRGLGVDSLMAVELRNRFEAGLHVSIPVDMLQSETAVSQTIDTLFEALKATNRPC